MSSPHLPAARRLGPPSFVVLVILSLCVKACVFSVLGPQILAARHDL